ncbi:family 43 glycosylhydrolase [Actinacidiphila guanduensis]|uniref:Glycosyl hydrolases family 43 n=1 Tax=Actinacidiphila guanduensis TaxID=310781 RepID=A0A1G9V1U4_9ACTN|nr:family 43 glycosylhydrolase [Actinacidiphila guanduensis]SDM66261.1 Glycosyl hydrolases family 43 [Actinacidiphila guanduensis]
MFRRLALLVTAMVAAFAAATAPTAVAAGPPAPAASSPGAGAAAASYRTTVTNSDSAGDPLVRFDTQGAAVDAHDGEISVFGGVYYLYGTSYDCGYRWQQAGTPFCGFKVYSSTDLVHWDDRGYLFDGTSSTWQTRCNGSTYGCFRPHVVYDAATARYVLWINVYDNSVGYRVFTATQPTGPFAEAAVPTLAVNNSAPVGGVNNGDHSVFVDDDGTAYLAYTDWRSGGDIVVERLSADYLTGTGAYVRLHQSATEAPALFRRGSTYYLTYSDPNCGYCGGTGTSYRTASSPLGTWSAGTKVTTNSCGGQPAFVSAIPTTSGTAYLYASDLWNNGAANEALANYFWAPLSFGSDGSIQPISCVPNFSLDLASGSAGAQRPAPDQDQSAGADGFRSWCDIGRNIARVQTFVAGRTGTLTSASYTTFQSGYPDAGLEIDLYTADSSFRPTGGALFHTVVPSYSIGWSPHPVTVYPNITVTAGTRYGIVVKSANAVGCYGMVHNDAFAYPSSGEGYSSDSGATFTPEAGRSTAFSTTVATRSALPAAALPAGWTTCAGEHGVCTATAPGMIAYGAPGGYVYQSVAAGPVPCTTASFGGDPDYNTLKSCGLAPLGGPSGYTRCADEGSACTVPGTHQVAYGQNGAFSVRQVTGGSVECSNDVFGDPLYSVVKSCYVSP